MFEIYVSIYLAALDPVQFQCGISIVKGVYWLNLTDSHCLQVLKVKCSRSYAVQNDEYMDR